MTKLMRELLWKLREDTVNGIAEPEPTDELDAWLDEQEELTAVCHAKDLARADHLLEQALFNNGLSLKIH